MREIQKHTEKKLFSAINLTERTNNPDFTYYFTEREELLN
jgi:hypothetical protein